MSKRLAVTLLRQKEAGGRQLAKYISSEVHPKNPLGWRYDELRIYKRYAHKSCSRPETRTRNNAKESYWIEDTISGLAVIAGFELAAGRYSGSTLHILPGLPWRRSLSDRSISLTRGFDHMAVEAIDIRTKLAISGPKSKSSTARALVSEAVPTNVVWFRPDDGTKHP